jgi:hypothetical protein
MYPNSQQQVQAGSQQSSYSVPSNIGGQSSVIETSALARGPTGAYGGGGGDAYGDHTAPDMKRARMQQQSALGYGPPSGAQQQQQACKFSCVCCFGLQCIAQSMC